ncbi:uncharacterized protein BP01DRAFT_367277 [Aspergillus saccharolyticus JOP 1030-1]|uniref:Uncharacterized protein n=1 Tax=Aspergillus saccharolyticus JOP 1030-1 TaxID=1450539 RepID=A0A318Z857_9EURO|nr:hypothetical protein BP01DRAFT_367277 [Aspergillus saccharolyticus JOP 1030-1]PYH43495.1 hypothetical protein BP01DRAFT_367277 [Aspergillus saccharolyticus JOP 1030-1]
MVCDCGGDLDVALFLTIAFRCGASQPWRLGDRNHCIDPVPRTPGATQCIFWAAISPIDLISEAILCVLPISLVRPVQVAVVCDHHHDPPSPLPQNTSASPSPILTVFATVITTQCVLCTSLMNACIPCLKPFLDAFDTGMLNLARNRQADTSASSYALGNVSRLKETSSSRQSRFIAEEAEEEGEGLGMSAAAFAVTGPTRLLGEEDEEERGWGGDGDSGVTSSPSLAIRRTDQWSARCE